MARTPYDYVVENFDFKKLTSSDEVTGDLDVGLGWSRLSARMIMRDHNCRGTRHDSQSKYLPGMAKNCIQRPNGHQVMPLDATTSVED